MAAQRTSVVKDIARPRMDTGKISDTMTHVTGPRDTAKHAIYVPIIGMSGREIIFSSFRKHSRDQEISSGSTEMHSGNGEMP